jgi:hypothetical protein
VDDSVSGVEAAESAPQRLTPESHSTRCFKVTEKLNKVCAILGRNQVYLWTRKLMMMSLSMKTKYDL